MLIRATTGVHVDSGSPLEDEISLPSPDAPLMLLQWLCRSDGLGSILGELFAEPDRVERAKLFKLDVV